MVLLLTNAEVASVLAMEDCVEAMQATFEDFAHGQAVNRPRSHTYVPLAPPERFYQFKSMDGGVPRYGVHAIRLSSEIMFFGTIDGTQRRDPLPSMPGNRWLGLVLLFSIHTGELLAVMPDGYVSIMRVGATSALAARALARPDADVVGLFGTGLQAGPQLQGLCAVRPVREIKVYSPNPEHRRAFVERMRPLLPAEIRAVDEPRAVVEGSLLVACATNALEPVFEAEWLAPGTHVNSLQGGELPDALLDRAALIVTRAPDQSTFWTMGEHRPGDMKMVQPLSEANRAKLRELGEVLIGKVGRTAPEQITVFGGTGTGPSSGLGIQFAAVGAKVYERARERGIGRELPLEWFTEEMHP